MRWHSRVVGVWGFGLLMAAGGCECDEGETLGRVVPQIEVEPLTVDFGEVPIGATKFISVNIENPGQATLEIQGVDTSLPFGVGAVETSVEAGTFIVLEVWFQPENTDPQSSQVVIASNADGEPMVSISVTGVGVANALEIAPRTLDFTDTTTNRRREAELQISNLGAANISGDILTMGFSRPQHFELTNLVSFDAPGPWTVAPRSQALLDLSYLPIEAGDDSGRILFEFCGERCGLLVTVQANAVESRVRVEPPVVDFGTVGINQTKTEQVLVWNEGDEPLTVEGFEVRATTEVEARISDTLPADISPGSSIAITLDYTPETANLMEGELSVRTNDLGLPEARVRMLGEGQGPLFLVQPDSVAFGVQTEASEAKRAVLLLNAGSSEVFVERLEVEGDGFSLTDVPGLPARLGAGESVVPSVTFTPSTLGEYTGTLRVFTTDPSAPMVEVPLSGGLAERVCELEISPEIVNFGLLPETYSRTRRVTLRNAGGEPCVLLSGDFRAPIDPAFIVGGSPWPVTLTTGQTLELDFTFAPNGAKDSKGSFLITTDEEVFPERAIALVASSKLYDDIVVLPPDLDFGVRKVGCSLRYQQVRVINVGTTHHVVDNLAITSTSSEFGLRSDLPGFMPPGESWTFEVGYAPTDEGFDSGEVEIYVQGKPYPIVVPIRGEGSENAETSDTFQQVQDRKVDVLFVIDDSCSMGDEQGALASNISSFISSASVRQVDFRLGITTTSIYGALGGQLVGPWMDSSTPGLESKFEAQAEVGIGGSGVEQGFEAMNAAFNLSKNGVGAIGGFFRVADGSVVVLIFVSDEDDRSFLPTDTYYSALVSEATNGFTVAAVTGQLNGCFSSQGFAQPAPRYERFLSLTGGLSLDICSNNWANTLAQLGDAAFGLLTRFVLREPADPAAGILVYVDGTPQPEGTAWRYDAASQSIVFNEGHVPPEGSEITVDYAAGCVGP